MLARIAAYVRGITRRRRIHAEVDEELHFHIEQATMRMSRAECPELRRDAWCYATSVG